MEQIPTREGISMPRAVRYARCHGVEYPILLYHGAGKCAPVTPVNVCCLSIPMGNVSGVDIYDDCKYMLYKTEVLIDSLLVVGDG